MGCSATVSARAWAGVRDRSVSHGGVRPQRARASSRCPSAPARSLNTESLGDIFHWAFWSAGKTGTAEKEGFQRKQAKPRAEERPVGKELGRTVKTEGGR